MDASTQGNIRDMVTECYRNRFRGTDYPPAVTEATEHDIKERPGSGLRLQVLPGQKCTFFLPSLYKIMYND